MLKSIPHVNLWFFGFSYFLFFTFFYTCTSYIKRKWWITYR